jgi:uncharacterized protein with NRDE domain
MCTVIIVRNTYDSYPIIVAANRDELLDRPSAPPKLWDGSPKLLAPVDKQRGGTWLGINEAGVFASVTNRRDVMSVRGMESRGELVIMSLEARTADEALERISRLDPRRYNGFHYVVADIRNGYVAYGDGINHSGSRVRVEPLVDGINLISNLGVGPDHAARADNIMRTWRNARLDRGPPHHSGFDLMLTHHDSEDSPANEGMKAMASVCVHRPERENYGTKSSAFIRLHAGRGVNSPEWLYRHRQRPVDEHGNDAGIANCRVAWQPEMRLPIV